MRQQLLISFLVSFLSLASSAQYKEFIHRSRADDFPNKPEVIAAGHIYREVVYIFPNYRRKKAGDSVGVSVSFYDTTGHIAETQYYNNGEHHRTTLYSYYTDNNLYSKKSINTDGRSNSEERYEYDSSGRQIRLYNLDKDTMISSIYETHYNLQGKMDTNFRYAQDGIRNLNKVYTYSDDGNTITATSIDTLGLPKYAEITEKANGVESFYLDNLSGQNLKWTRYYNENGQLIKEVLPLDIRRTFLSHNHTYVYNADGTIYEHYIDYSNGDKELYRHYYYKQ